MELTEVQNFIMAYLIPLLPKAANANMIFFNMISSKKSPSYCF